MGHMWSCRSLRRNTVWLQLCSEGAWEKWFVLCIFWGCSVLWQLPKESRSYCPTIRCGQNYRVSPLSECICTITNWDNYTLYGSQIQVPFLEARMNPHAFLQFAVESSETWQGFEEADSPTKFSAAMAYLSPSLVSLGSLPSFFTSNASDLLVEHSMFADCWVIEKGWALWLGTSVFNF